MKWTLTVSDTFPFDLTITDQNGNVVTRNGSVATSSFQRTRQDNKEAVGFRWPDREAIVEMVAQQESNFELMAAAPEIRDVLREFVGDVLAAYRTQDDEKDGVDQALWKDWPDLCLTYRKARAILARLSS